jgi:hypothetical protein
VASKLYQGPGQSWVRGQAGGTLYVVFWILAALLVWPRLPARIVAVAVLALTSILEVLQLWQAPALVAIRNTFIGHALIGSTFSPWDLPYYLLGAILGVVLARAARARAAG